MSSKTTASKTTKRSRRPAAKGKSTKASSSIAIITDTGKAIDPKIATVRASGPTTVHKKKDLKETISSVTKAVNQKKKQDSKVMYIHGTGPSTYQLADNVNYIIGFAQAWTLVFDQHFPHVFRREEVQISGRQLYPCDLVAYCTALIIGGYARVNNLQTSIAGIDTAIPEHAPVPIAIAEYIRRINCVGAPNMRRMLNLGINPTIVTGEFVYNANPTAGSLSVNQLGGFSGMGNLECWSYGTAAASSTMDPQDLSIYSVPLVYSLFGANSWCATRLNLVIDALNSLELGKVPFCDVPRSTTDISSFGGSSNGTAWSSARFAEFPAPNGNVWLAIVFNYRGANNYCPGMVYNASVPRVTWAVTGGVYANSFAGLIPWAGQPVVPANASVELYAMQCFMNITLFQPNLRDRFFGKHGYHYYGRVVYDFGRIVAVPIDYPSVVQRCVRAHIRYASQGDAAAFFPGNLQGLYLLYGAIVVRKVLNSQLETWASLSSGTSTNIWNVQAMYPSQSYLAKPLPLPVQAIIDGLAPVAVDGVLRVPAIGAGYMVNQLNAGGANRFNLIPKWCGWVPSGGALFPDGLIPNPDDAAPGDPKTWTFPYFMGYNPTVANWALEYTSSAFNVNYGYTVFPGQVTSFSGGDIVGGGDAIQQWAITSFTGPTYDNASNAEWVTNAYANGRFTRLCFQYQGVNDAMSQLFGALTKLSKVQAGKLLQPSVRGIVGGAGMSTIIQYEVNYGKKAAHEVGIVQLTSGSLSGVVAAGATMDYHGDSRMQAMAFCNRGRLAASFMLNVCSFPISAQSTPPAAAYFSAAPYQTDLANLTTYLEHDNYTCECLQEGSTLNNYAAKMATKMLSKREAESGVSLGTAEPNVDSEISSAIVQKHCADSNLQVAAIEISAQEMEEAVEVMKATGEPTQTVELLRDMLTSLPEDQIDFNFKQFSTDIVNGIKWITPKAAKLGVALAPLLV